MQATFSSSGDDAHVVPTTKAIRKAPYELVSALDMILTTFTPKGRVLIYTRCLAVIRYRWRYPMMAVQNEYAECLDSVSGALLPRNYTLQVRSGS